MEQYKEQVSGVNSDNQLLTDFFEHEVPSADGLATISISGTFGSGKTTFIDSIKEKLGPGTFYIFNDGIRAEVDPAQIELEGSAGLDSEIRSFATGCACCQTYPEILATLEQIVEDRKDGRSQIERVVIELPGNANNSSFRQRIGRKDGIDVAGVSLINVENFDRDQVLGLVDRHIGSSSMIMLTWADGLELSDPHMKKVLEYIFLEQELSVPVAVLRKDGSTEVIDREAVVDLIGPLPDTAKEEVGQAPQLHVLPLVTLDHNHGEHHSHEGHDHDHHGHDHSHHGHGHGHHHHDTLESSLEVELKADVDWQSVMERLQPWFEKDVILRVKGIMKDSDSGELAYVSGTRDKVNVRPLKGRETELGTFIAMVSLEPVPKEVFADVSVELPSVAVGSFLKYNRDVRVEAVRGLLQELQQVRQEKDLHKGEAGELVVVYDMFENLDDFTGLDDMPSELRKEALQELLEVRLAAASDLVAGNFNDPNDRKAYWGEILGGHIAHYIVHEPDVLEGDLQQRLASVQPATMFFEGLANRAIGEPQQEEARPTADLIEWYRSIVQYGRDAEGLTRDIVESAFERCRDRDTSGQWKLGFGGIEEMIRDEF